MVVLNSEIHSEHIYIGNVTLGHEECCRIVLSFQVFDVSDLLAVQTNKECSLEFFREWTFCFDTHFLNATHRSVKWEHVHDIECTTVYEGIAVEWKHTERIVTFTHHYRQHGAA